MWVAVKGRSPRAGQARDLERLVAGLPGPVQDGFQALPRQAGGEEAQFHVCHVPTSVAPVGEAFVTED